MCYLLWGQMFLLTCDDVSLFIVWILVNWPPHLTVDPCISQRKKKEHAWFRSDVKFYGVLCWLLLKLPPSVVLLFRGGQACLVAPFRSLCRSLSCFACGVVFTFVLSSEFELAKGILGRSHEPLLFKLPNHIGWWGLRGLKKTETNVSLRYSYLCAWKVVNDTFVKCTTSLLNRLSCQHSVIPTCVGNFVVVSLTLGHSKMCWLFVFKFGWLAIGQKFLPPLIHPNFKLWVPVELPRDGTGIWPKRHPTLSVPSTALFYMLTFVAYLFDAILPGGLRWSTLHWLGVNVLLTLGTDVSFNRWRCFTFHCVNLGELTFTLDSWSVHFPT